MNERTFHAAVRVSVTFFTTLVVLVVLAATAMYLPEGHLTVPDVVLFVAFAAAMAAAAALPLYGRRR